MRRVPKTHFVQPHEKRGHNRSWWTASCGRVVDFSGPYVSLPTCAICLKAWARLWALGWRP